MFSAEAIRLALKLLDEKWHNKALQMIEEAKSSLRAGIRYEFLET